MDIKDLYGVLDELKTELEHTKANGEKHVKAASARARGLINEIKKNATELKRQLLKLDREN